MRVPVLFALTLAGACNPLQRLEPFGDEPNVPSDPGQTLPNTPTEPTIDTDVVIIDTDETDTPVEPVADFLAMSAGEDFSCVVFGDGELRCWGSNAGGRSEAPAGEFVDVSAGIDHACAVRDDGALLCWGDNTGGKATPPAGAFRHVAVGSTASCAVGVDNLVTCWGVGLTPPADLGEMNRLALGDTFACGIRRTTQDLVCWGIGAAATTAPVGDTWIRIAAGSGHACAVQADRDIVCWGDNAVGQTDAPTSDAINVFAKRNQSCAVDGNGGATCWGASVAVPEGRYDAIIPGIDHLCVTREDTIECFGDGSLYQTVPPRRSDVSDVSVGAGHVCWLSSSGAPSCLGTNNSGQATPVAGSYDAISAGFSHTCAIAGNTITCWGSNDRGELDEKTDAGQVYVDVHAGRLQTCGRTTAGAIECWGNNYDTFAPIPGPNTSLALGDFHGCAVSGGVASCWGVNNFGQRVPPEGFTWTSVAAGYNNSCGITNTGSAMCWGADTEGKSTPPAGTYSHLALGFDNTCGVTTGGNVACWGDNTKRQNNAPAVTFTTVSVGNGFACGVTTEGGLRCWGDRTL